jgi:hypothetical protein
MEALRLAKYISGSAPRNAKITSRVCLGASSTLSHSLTIPDLYYNGQIDEHSPDEDERMAIANLQEKGDVHGNKKRKHKAKPNHQPQGILSSISLRYAYTSGIGQIDAVGEAPHPRTTFDVLENHHDKNRRPRAPDAEMLREIGQEHPRNTSPVSVDDPVDMGSDNTQNSGSDSDSESGAEPATKRAKRHSKVPYDQENKGKPTQLQFYPLHWRDVLEKAKKKKRLHTVQFRQFSERDHHLRDATDCLTETLAEFRREGGRVEPGRSFPP